MLPVVGASATDAVPTFLDMPDNWATKALESTVANGLLKGSDDGRLLPDEPLTRAQMAAIIARAFGATEPADISAYMDIKSTDWFADDIAKAVKMGVIQGYEGKMTPNSNITREQAFVVLARALKLEPATSISKAFTDVSAISDWAKGHMYAMINAGYIQGSNGKLNPQVNITRAEVAQVMYNVLKQYIKIAGEYTNVADGNVMVNAPGVILKNVTINGDLIIGDGVGEGDLTLDNVIVKGRLVARGGGVNSIIIKGGSVEGKVIVAKVDGKIRVSVEGGADVEVIVIDDGKDDVIIEGKVGTVQVETTVPVMIKNATVNKVEVNCEGATAITVATGATVTNVIVEEKAEGSSINVNGQVANVQTSAPGTSISGTGSVSSVTAKAGADGTSVTTPNTVVSNQGASGVTAGGGKEVPSNGSATNNSSGSDIVTHPAYEPPYTPPEPVEEYAFYSGFDGGNLGVFAPNGDAEVVDNGAGTISIKPIGDSTHGAYTNFGSYSSEWPTGGYTTRVKVYIDPSAMESGQGFTWSSAINNRAGTYLSEQLTHIRKIGGAVKIGNKGGVSNDQEDQYTGDTISAAGYYTIQTRYYEEEGIVKAELKVIGEGNNVIHSSQPVVLKNSPENVLSDIAVSEAGGNRYGWFTYIDMGDTGVIVDEVSLIK